MTRLRVIWPDNWAPSRVQSAQTLIEFYESYVLPIVREPKNRSQGTITQDRIALRHWQRITGDPPLEKITPELCAKFIRTLAKEGRSSSTVRKTAVHLQFILDHAGPPDRRHRNAAAIMSQVPYLERPENIPQEPEPAFTIGEIESLIEACRTASASQAILFPDHALWWACLIRFAWHTALRRMNLLNARWSWMTSDSWLVIPASGYKQHKSQRRFYVSSQARKVAQRVRVPGEDRIFAWNGTEAYFHEHFRRIAAALPIGRRYSTKAIRRATLTWLAERNPLVSRLVAGHRKLDVLEDFYIQRQIVIDLLEAMPSPKGWDL